MLWGNVAGVGGGGGNRSECMKECLSDNCVMGECSRSGGGGGGSRSECMKECLSDNCVMGECSRSVCVGRGGGM